MVRALQYTQACCVQSYAILTLACDICARVQPICMSQHRTLTVRTTHMAHNSSSIGTVSANSCPYPFLAIAIDPRFSYIPLKFLSSLNRGAKESRPTPVSDAVPPARAEVGTSWRAVAIAHGPSMLEHTRHTWARVCGMRERGRSAALRNLT